MAMVNIIVLLINRYIKVDGIEVLNKVKVYRHFQMDLYMMVNLKMDWGKGMVRWDINLVINIKGNGMLIRNRVEV